MDTSNQHSVKDFGEYYRTNSSFRIIDNLQCDNWDKPILLQFKGLMVQLLKSERMIFKVISMTVNFLY